MIPLLSTRHMNWFLHSQCRFLFKYSVGRIGLQKAWSHLSGEYWWTSATPTRWFRLSSHCITVACFLLPEVRRFDTTSHNKVKLKHGKPAAFSRVAFRCFKAQWDTSLFHVTAYRYTEIQLWVAAFWSWDWEQWKEKEDSQGQGPDQTVR